MIDIITYSDSYQKILKTLFFKPSFDLFLSNDFNHIDFVKDTNIDDAKEFGFGSEVFQQIIYERWEILIDHIKKNSDPNKISIFSDIDIVFFGNIKNIVVQLFRNPNIDIYFMPETPDPMNINPKNNFNINAGFFIFRHSEQTLEFFEYILNFMRSQSIKEDQFYITQYLKNNYYPNIRLLNFNTFNANNCPLDLNIELLNNQTLKVFHATSCINLNEKIKVLYTITKPIHSSLLATIK